MTEELGEFYQTLRREYLSEAPARLGELRKDLAAVLAGESDAVASLKSRFHRLAGSGGSYGFPAISETGREAELWIAANPEPDELGFAWLGSVIGRIAAAFDDAARELGHTESPHKQPPFGWRAQLIGHAGDLAARLTFALRDAQYTVVNVPLDTDPGSIPASERPDIAVILPGPDQDPAEAVTRWTGGGLERRLRVALVSDPRAHDPLSDPFARLDVLVAPSRAEAELSRWARVVARTAAAPAAVLLVMNDALDRSAVAGWLEGAGLRVTQVGTAAEAYQTLQQELPDIVVLDWPMPDGRGPGVARLIRRSPRLAILPIVALAGGEIATVRSEALEAGVDELIPRPLREEDLVATVVHRAARSRHLDEAVRRDPLSGFLTLGTLLDELESVIAFARREGERISFLLLDIDHFRRVNEQLGHYAGDQILGHLSRLIRERVRASDLVVRMGGEEFGVLFRHCGPADASLVAEHIRAAVQTHPPLVDGVPMPVRLSGGVAGYPDHAVGMHELLLAAERALRQAKETGRDKVVVAG